MKLLNAIAALIGAVVLTGCAATQMDNLRNVQEQRGMLLKEPISFVFDSSTFMLAGVQAGLFPGYYKATRENENGTFYVGPGHCVWFKPRDEYVMIAGGVWLPKNTQNPVRLFSIPSRPSENVKTRDEAAAKCKQPESDTVPTELVKNDQQTSVVVAPQALGIKPAGPNGVMSGSQMAGGIIGIAIVSAFADTELPEFQVLQKVEDPEALRKISEAVQLAEKVQAK